MRRPKIILYIIYLLFIGISLCFILFTDKIFESVGIQKTLNFLKYWSIFGLVLFLVEIITENISLRNRRKEVYKLKKENESLKARIYDMEEKERNMDTSIKAFEGSLKSGAKGKADPENS